MESGRGLDERRAITLEIAERGAQWGEGEERVLLQRLRFWFCRAVDLRAAQERSRRPGSCRPAGGGRSRNNASLRAYFRRRFRAIIVDEYQDTDPLQVEIIETLAAGFLGGSASRIRKPARVAVVVGDPKQSIYRFRRADAFHLRVACEVARTRPGVEFCFDPELPLDAGDPAIREPVLRERHQEESIRPARLRSPGSESGHPRRAESPLALRFTVPAEADSFVLEAGGEAPSRPSWPRCKTAPAGS